MKNTTTSIAYMRESCDEFNLFNINIFDFSGNKKREFKLDNSFITIEKNKNKTFKVDFICPVCKENHSFIIPYNQFFTDDVFTFSCPFYEADILFIGNFNKVKKTVNEYLKQELQEVSRSYSSSNENILENLIKLNQIIEKHADKIKICDCNKTYTTAYNENEIYIICNECHYSLPLNYDKIDLFLEDIEKH